MQRRGENRIDLIEDVRIGLAGGVYLPRQCQIGASAGREILARLPVPAGRRGGEFFEPDPCFCQPVQRRLWREGSVESEILPGEGEAIGKPEKFSDGIFLRCDLTLDPGGRLFDMIGKGLDQNTAFAERKSDPVELRGEVRRDFSENFLILTISSCSACRSRLSLSAKA